MKRIMLALLFSLYVLTVSCKENSETTLALDWYPNSNHGGIYTALEKEYFKNEGLIVEVYIPSDPSSILQTVGAGKDDFGISYQPDLLLARSQGIPVVSIASIVQVPLNSIMSLSSSNILSPSDLKGKKIGYPGIPLNIGILESILESEGLTISDVELLDVGFDLVPVLLSETVDAVIGAYWTHESILIEMEGQGVNIMKLDDWGVPAYYELILVTNEKMIEENSLLVEKFVKSFINGYLDSINNPKDSLNYLIKANPEMNAALEDKGLDLLVPLWSSAKPKFGSQEKSVWDSFSQWMIDKNLIDKNLDISKAYNPTFVDNLD